jgi:hypothetical protein
VCRPVVWCGERRVSRRSSADALSDRMPFMRCGWLQVELLEYGGTSTEVGMCTKRAVMHKASFNQLFGLDKESWVLVKDKFHHNGSTKGLPFTLAKVCACVSAKSLRWNCVRGFYRVRVCVVALLL